MLALRVRTCRFIKMKESQQSIFRTRSKRGTADLAESGILPAVRRSVPYGGIPCHAAYLRHAHASECVEAWPANDELFAPPTTLGRSPEAEA